MNAWPMRVVGALLLTLLLSGCAGLLIGGAAVGFGLAHDRRSTGSVVDDQSIELRLHNALKQELPSGNQIGVTSYNGTVLLTGQALSDSERQRAESIARGSMLRIREVYNEIVVGSPSDFYTRSNDTFLTTKVKAALLRIKLVDFDPTRVKVVTEQGVVYLMGLVRPEESDSAATVASQVNGVRQVITLFEYIKV